MNKTIPSNIRNRVSHTFSMSNGDVFYLMIHDCGELLLCSVDNYSACKLDSGSIGVPKGRDNLWIMKNDWEAKIDISNLNETDIPLLLAETGMPANPSERLAALTGRKTKWYGAKRNWQSPMMRSVLTWADKHPRLAKSGSFKYLIESVRQVINTPLPLDEYTGF